MDDTANKRELALAVGRLLAEHKAEETVVLDVGTAASWADYLIIATARSTVHAIGLVREVDAYLSARAVRPVNPHKKLTENGWQLLDCGDFVVHVMLQEQRDFYALEKLWFKGTVLDLSEEPPAGHSASNLPDCSAQTASGRTTGTLPGQVRAARKKHGTETAPGSGASETAPKSGASGTREGHSSKSS